jgi:Icc-related predicted phosphoesterase
LSNTGDGLSKLPKSAKEILKLIKNQKTWTQDEIEKNLTNFVKDEIKYALKRLHEFGIVVKIANLSDMRRVYYRIVTEDEFLEIHKISQISDIKFYRAILQKYIKPRHHQSSQESSIDDLNNNLKESVQRWENEGGALAQKKQSESI